MDRPFRPPLLCVPEDLSFCVPPDHNLPARQKVCPLVDARNPPRLREQATPRSPSAPNADSKGLANGQSRPFIRVEFIGRVPRDFSSGVPRMAWAELPPEAEKRTGASLAERPGFLFPGGEVGSAEISWSGQGTARIRMKMRSGAGVGRTPLMVSDAPVAVRVPGMATHWPFSSVAYSAAYFFPATALKVTE